MGALAPDRPEELVVGVAEWSFVRRAQQVFAYRASRASSRLVNSLAVIVFALALTACEREERDFRKVRIEPIPPRTLSALTIGGGTPERPPRKYEQNAYDVSQGKQLFSWFNCNGCHAKGGGGMGPALMDDEWIYGSSIDAIAATITEGRPNGMPSFRNRATQEEIWQLAAYVTAVRTKPFVILAGVTGTGKTQLPLLVAQATGGTSEVIPVRPDWTDSGDLLGYTDLQQRFRPGPLLIRARKASDEPGRYHVFVLDEMNIARVEHYLAEVLSAIERRSAVAGGGFETAPLLPTASEE